MLIIVKFFIGTVLLVLGADWLVKGATAVAKRFNIPTHVIGLTLVALGTSAPELFVNVLAAWHGNSDFALSNVSGSNLANLAVGFGLCAVLATAPIRRADFFADLMLVWIAPLVVFVLLCVRADGALPFFSVLPLGALLIWYLWSLVSREHEEVNTQARRPSLQKGTIFFLAGVAALYFGGEMVLHSAIVVARMLEVSEDVIALTIVAFGTSIPDITASVVAAKKGEHGIAVGNLLGSNISNITVVLNATLLVTGESLAASRVIRVDYLAVFAVSLFVFLAACRVQKIPTWCGWAMIVFYAMYLMVRIVAA